MLTGLAGLLTHLGNLSERGRKEGGGKDRKKEDGGW